MNYGKAIYPGAQNISLPLFQFFSLLKVHWIAESFKAILTDDEEENKEFLQQLYYEQGTSFLLWMNAFSPCW